MVAALVPLGVALTLAGLAGLGWFIYATARARSAALEEREMKARLSKLLAVNLASVALAALGLMCLIIGLFLG
ncbi:MAG: hypothetical protein AAGI03_11215 [Pseudomonadota bacterium]